MIVIDVIVIANWQCLGRVSIHDVVDGKLFLL